MREAMPPLPHPDAQPVAYQSVQEFARAPVWIEDASRPRVTQAIQPSLASRNQEPAEMAETDLDRERLSLLLAQVLTGLLTLVNAVAFLLILGPQGDDRVFAVAVLVALLSPILLLRRLALLLDALLLRRLSLLRSRLLVFSMIRRPAHACRCQPHTVRPRVERKGESSSRRWPEGETRRNAEIFPSYEYQQTKTDPRERECDG